MNDEAASGTGPQGGPAPTTAPEPGTAPGPGVPPGTPPGPGAGPGAGPNSSNIPPWVSAAHAAFTRQQLVRPRHPRYIAGVCGALARATNTDPVLWRVLLAVLGILGGAGVLLYLIGWLIIPSEGDAASPLESLLGKGQSGMQPLSVVLLGGAALLTFAFIVSSGARASMLAAAVIVGAFLLIKRGGVHSGAFKAPPTDYPPPASPPSSAPSSAPSPEEEPTVKFTPPPAYTPPPGYAPPPPDPAYRAPFAPYGPFAGPTPPPPPAPPAPKPPKPPKERSVLGRLTFFALLVVMGVMVLADMSGLSVSVSAYFAAALITIALGLIVGTWFGRARGLIFLALLTTMGLLISTGTERFGNEFENNVYRPASLAEIADRYDFTLGNVTLDLSDVDFGKADQTVAVDMKVGQLRVVLPPEVDTTAAVEVGGGRAELFGEEYNSTRDQRSHEVTDLGSDGAGGGSLRLDLKLDTGNVEVTR
ncbi:PspC domain-containing protein [Actinoplanes sp. NPDC051851]|uniref:PspC domain-containing protein n=1 Tax=Actinoplanes sp. NPDC051851 TaxID=3154753 RepID=UPI00342CCA14